MRHSDQDLDIDVSTCFFDANESESTTRRSRSSQKPKWRRHCASAQVVRRSVTWRANSRVSEHTLYIWKKKYASLDVADIRKVRQLEEENSKLKRLVADLSLDKVMLQDLVSRKR